MEREEILKSLRDLKSQLPIDGLDEVTISEQAKRFDQARRITERAERRISELEEKLKNDENYRTGRVALYDNSVEQNKVDLEDMIARSDRLAADIIGIDRRLEQERKNRELAEQYNDQALLATLDSNIQRLERRAAKRNSDLEELNANIHELEEAIKEQEEATTGSATVDIEALINAGLIKKALDGVKVLGNGEISKKLTVKVNAYSDSAKQKIEAAGGKAEVI